MSEMDREYQILETRARQLEAEFNANEAKLLGEGESAVDGSMTEAHEAMARWQATMAINFGAEWAESRYSDAGIVYGDDVRVKCIESLTPALAKYQGALPDWLQNLIDQYKEEIGAVTVIGGVIFSSWVKINAHKRAVKNNRKAPHKAPHSAPRQESKPPQEADLFKGVVNNGN